MRNSVLNRSLLFAGLVFLGAPLAACHTVEGAGKDIKSVGHTVEHTADEAGDEMGDAMHDLEDGD